MIDGLPAYQRFFGENLATTIAQGVIKSGIKRGAHKESDTGFLACAGALTGWKACVTFYFPLLITPNRSR